MLFALRTMGREKRGQAPFFQTAEKSEPVPAFRL
jgi:hypothetical protein